VNLRAFTLIELLIVVAIIAILAAIAVPNFIEAQTRAKVSRLKSDMRTSSLGLNSYYVDNNAYPWDAHHDGRAGIGLLGNNGWFFNRQVRLTTPVAYLSSVNFPDPFFSDQGMAVEAGQIVTSFRYFNYGKGGWGGDPVVASVVNNSTFPRVDVLPVEGFLLASYGPYARAMGASADSKPEYLVSGIDRVNRTGVFGADQLYDPTNGTYSFGAIVRLETAGGTNISNP